jgi:DNA-binding CsgD family transcriptional regulator
MDDERQPLTPRELQVLKLSAYGLSNQDIGARLHLAIDTIKTHQRKLQSKLKARDRTHAVAIAYESGLLRLGTVNSTVVMPGTDQRLSFLEEQVTTLINEVYELTKRRRKRDLIKEEQRA